MSGWLGRDKDTYKSLGDAYASIYENRRAARAAGGYVDDSKKQTDPSKDGFTGISGSIKDIMRQNKEIEAKNKAMKKESKTTREIGHALMDAYSLVIEKDNRSSKERQAAENSFDAYQSETGEEKSKKEWDKEQKAKSSKPKTAAERMAAAHDKREVERFNRYAKEEFEIVDEYAVSEENAIALEEGKKKCKEGYKYDKDKKKCVKKKKKSSDNKSSKTTIIVGRGYGYGGHHHHDDDNDKETESNGGGNGGGSGGDGGGGDGGGGGE